MFIQTSVLCLIVGQHRTVMLPLSSLDLEPFLPVSADLGSEITTWASTLEEYSQFDCLNS